MPRVQASQLPPHSGSLPIALPLVVDLPQVIQCISVARGELEQFLEELFRLWEVFEAVVDLSQGIESFCVPGLGG